MDLEIESSVGEHDLAEVLLEVAERGGELAAGENEALGNLGARDLVDVRQRGLLLPKRRRGYPRTAAPPLPRPGPWLAHDRSVGRNTKGPAKTKWRRCSPSRRRQERKTKTGGRLREKGTGERNRYEEEG